MEAAALAAIISGAIQILETVIPRIQAAVDKGEISTEQQSTLMAQVDAFRNPKGPAFGGPEWVPSTAPTPTPGPIA